MAPGDAVNLSTHLQGNHLLLNVTDGIHCFYNLCGRILEEPPSLPSPPKLLCRERFLVEAQQSKHKRQSKKGDPTELSQKIQELCKKAPGDVKLECKHQPRAATATLTWCLSPFH